MLATSENAPCLREITRKPLVTQQPRRLYWHASGAMSESGTGRGRINGPFVQLIGGWRRVALGTRIGAIDAGVAAATFIATKGRVGQRGPGGKCSMR